MKGKRDVKIVAIVMAITLLTPIWSYAQDASDRDKPISISVQGTSPSTKTARINKKVLAEMQQIEKQFMKGGGLEKLEFDVEAARGAGFSETAISFEEQLAAFTNALLDDAESATRETGLPLTTYSVRQLRKSDLSQEFPLVHELFMAAKKLAKQKPSGSSGGDMEISAWYDNPYTVCGYFGNPQPWGAAIALRYTVSGDRNSWLYARGYHPTPTRYFGGGWTRPRTYRPDMCKYNSFRDHAWFGSQSNVIWEQNYQYSVPNGEPNPEIYTYLWPYPTWPAYVAYWHYTH